MVDEGDLGDGRVQRELEPLRKELDLGRRVARNDARHGSWRVGQRLVRLAEVELDVAHVLHPVRRREAFVAEHTREIRAVPIEWRRVIE